MHSSRSKRHLPRRRRGVNALVYREPALINLPVTLPSVPLLSPLLDPLVTPLIDGQHPTSTTAVASPTPTPSQTSPSDGGSDPGGSSGNDGGNSGSEDGNGNSDGTSDGGNGNTAGGSTSTSDGNPANGSTFTQSAGSSPSGTSSIGTVTSTDSSSSFSSVPSSGAVEPAPNNTAAEPVSNAATNVDTDNSISNDNFVGSDDSSSTSGSLSSVVGGQSSSGTLAGTISAPTSVGSNTPGSGSGGGKSGVDPASVAGATSSHSLSGGAIGGIVVGVLFLLALVFFILRRRAQIRRNERHTRWLFFAGETEHKYGSTSDMARQRQSQRSSFGTPFNDSLFSEDTGRVSPTFGNVPPFPPTAQVHTPHSAPLIVTVTTTTDEFVSGQRTSTFSIGSGQSSSSYSDNGDGQVLTIPSAVHDARGSAADTPTTPMSVRPFSPSERFSFPKPPERQSMTSSTNNTPATAKADFNPFADPERTTSTFGSPVPSGLVTEKQTLDPFSDPSDRPATASSIRSVCAVAGTRETVSRPFAPTMHDELMVIPGEEVTIIQAFDDGWAQVQNERKEIGLIPLDCFRTLGEEVPSFLASRRVSSYLRGNTSV